MRKERATDRATSPRRRRGSLARVLHGAVLALVCAVLVFAAGFVFFLFNVPSEEVRIGGKADAIVVLTGGSSRVDDGIELLAAGYGRRLLITGVHHQTSEREIAQLKPEHARLIACCVDLDRSALNTIGNAAETRRWVDEQGFRSLIIVTSNYHMPRAMVELNRQLPDIELISFPVVAKQLQDRWTSSPNLRLLLAEYVKYVGAVIRLRLPFQIT